jgi:hypothetical protein
MKKFNLIILIFVLIFSSCSKSEDDEIQVLSGDWDLVEERYFTNNSLTGNVLQNDEELYNWILKFSSNGTVELFEDGIIECKSSSGSLKINSGPTVILLCDVEFLVTIMPNDKLLLTRNPGPDRYEYEFKKL